MDTIQKGPRSNFLEFLFVFSFLLLFKHTHNINFTVLVIFRCTGDITYFHSVVQYHGYFLLIFYWSTVNLQCCVNFCCPAKWLRYIHVCILFYFLFCCGLFLIIKCSSLCTIVISQFYMWWFASAHPRVLVLPSP